MIQEDSPKRKSIKCLEKLKNSLNRIR